MEASLVAKHRLYGMCASVVAVCRLRCSVASGILMQFPALASRFPTPGHQGSPLSFTNYLPSIWKVAQSPEPRLGSDWAFYSVPISTSSRELSVSAPRHSPFLLPQSSPPAFRPFAKIDFHQISLETQRDLNRHAKRCFGASKFGKH